MIQRPTNSQGDRRRDNGRRRRQRRSQVSDDMLKHGEPGPETSRALVNRRTVLSGAAAATAAALLAPRVAHAGAGASPAQAAGATSAEKWRTGLPDQLAEVIESWASTPSSHPYIGDWRRAGYRRGAEPPREQVTTAFDAGQLGATADQDADQSPALQAAIDRIGGAGGGVLSLGPGRYRLDSPLFMRHSNVVLRGSGVDKTTLYFTRPLQESIGPAPSGNQSSWSWTGGQVFFLAPERLARSKEVMWDNRSEGWLPGPALANVAPATRGTDVLLVDDSSKLKAGDFVLLEVDNLADQRLLREIAGNIAGATTYPWPATGKSIAFPTAFEDLKTFRWPVVVSEVLSPRTVRIEQPLRLEIHRETPARLLELGPTVRDSGVEQLTIENKLLPQTAHNLNPGSNGVCFQAVIDCWAKDVRVLNADVAFGMTAAKSCTYSGISAGGRSLHHFVACRVESHDNLIEDFVLEDFTVPAETGALLHGINVEGLSSGNVYRRGLMQTGTFDSHRQMPFENLRTNIEITNKDAVVGGALDAGPYFGARTVHWGVAVTNDNNFAIEISDIAPRSMTAGLVGLQQPGSGGMGRVPGGGFIGDLESERLAFGTDLEQGRDLLDIQRAAAPLVTSEQSAEPAPGAPPPAESSQQRSPGTQAGAAAGPARESARALPATGQSVPVAASGLGLIVAAALGRRGRGRAS